MKPRPGISITGSSRASQAALPHAVERLNRLVSSLSPPKVMMLVLYEKWDEESRASKRASFAKQVALQLRNDTLSSTREARATASSARAVKERKKRVVRLPAVKEGSTSAATKHTSPPSANSAKQRQLGPQPCLDYTSYVDSSVDCG